MNGLAGMEKFSHLEDKIYLTIENVRKLREEKERIEREMKSLRHEVSNLLSEKSRLEEKVEAMLDAMTVIEPDVAEAVHR